MTPEQRKTLNDWVDHAHNHMPEVCAAIVILLREYDALLRTPTSEETKRVLSDLRSQRVVDPVTQQAAIGVIERLSRSVGELEERVKARPSINLRGEEVNTYEKRIAELERSLQRAFEMLAAYGVPKERARSVANGIDVLMTRIRKEQLSKEGK